MHRRDSGSWVIPFPGLNPGETVRWSVSQRIKIEREGRGVNRVRKESSTYRGLRKSSRHLIYILKKKSLNVLPNLVIIRFVSLLGLSNHFRVISHRMEGVLLDFSFVQNKVPLFFYFTGNFWFKGPMGPTSTLYPQVSVGPTKVSRFPENEGVYYVLCLTCT